MADTTQPAGALPEPDYPSPDEMTDGWSAPQMRALMAERDAALKTGRELLGSLGQANAAALALIKQRDALRRELEELRKTAFAAYNSIDEDGRNEPEMVALARTLLAPGSARPIPPDARDCTDGDGHVYAAASKAHTTPEQNAAVEASIERVAAFAREGREPLTPEQQHALWQKANGEWLTDEADFKAGIRAAEKHHGIRPAGTSADGETQP